MVGVPKHRHKPGPAGEVGRMDGRDPEHVSAVTQMGVATDEDLCPTAVSAQDRCNKVVNRLNLHRAQIGRYRPWYPGTSSWRESR